MSVSINFYLCFNEVKAMDKSKLLLCLDDDLEEMDDFFSDDERTNLAINLIPATYEAKTIDKSNLLLSLDDDLEEMDVFFSDDDGTNLAINLIPALYEVKTMDKSNLLLFLDDDLEDVDDFFSDDDGTNLAINLIPAAVTLSNVTIESDFDEVIKSCSDEKFHKLYRVTKKLAMELSEKFENSEIYNRLKSCHSRLNISPLKHILIFLRFAGKTSTFRDVCKRYQLSVSSLFAVLSRVMKFVLTMQESAICFPTEMEKHKSMNLFAEISGLPNIVGVIDTLHINIDKPIKNQQDFQNLKGYYSVVLQAVCNEELKFLDCFVGYPGSADDEEIFRNSSLSTNILNLCNNEAYIIGDNGFPLEPFLITPYVDDGCLSFKQKHFNGALNTCHVYAQHAFTLLKRRFRQLNHLKFKNPERISQFIKACCIFHNLALGDGLYFNDRYIDEVEQPDSSLTCKYVDDETTKKRDLLCNYLHQRR